jgi:calcineurin-like phosphoesterase family protein
MKTFVTSDIHFSHKNILKYCPLRMKSSFYGHVNDMTAEEITEAVEIMNEYIIKNWNSLVCKDDTVLRWVRLKMLLL